MVNLPRSGTLRQKRQSQGCARSSSVGAAICTVRYIRGSSAPVTRRIALPLPAASCPSNKASTPRLRSLRSRSSRDSRACSSASCCW